MTRAWLWILRALGAAVVLLGLVVGGAVLWLRGSLPETEGTLEIAGLEAPVEVLRDADGLVTIRAANERDAALALGYVHAQDRLWQMDFMRRTGAGRLSELLGPRTLRFDRFMRTLGLARVAEANVAALAPRVRRLLEAYAAGVNAFLADPGGPLPLEFHILGYEPGPWRPADSLLWGRLMAFQLSGNWPEELLRARLAQRLRPEQVDFLWPGYPAGAPVSLPDLAALDGARLRRLADILPWQLRPKDASNAWVLAGPLTASGLPLLANDTHLALSAPGTWYLARIETPELTLAGATAPGVPFHILGHNGHIAWGTTTTHSDTQDLFMERVAEGDPARYMTPEGPRPFETRQEVIEVRDGAPERITVRRTRHGPVISDVVPQAEDAAETETVLALAWPGFAPDDRSAEALYAINRARGWRAFRAALERFHSPHQNFVYADTGGTIGFAAPARVPIRRRGDGRAPVPGWSGAYDWVGEIPFDELPLAVDPPAQRVVSANNKVVPDDYRYLLSADWPDPYRAQRIAELLDSDGVSGGSPEGARAMQQDVESLAVRALLPLLLETEPTSERARAALSVLRAWDGRLTRDSPAPLAFYAWVRELTRVLLADELDADFADFRRADVRLLVRVLRAGQEWCDDVATPARETCAQQLAVALEDALDRIALRFRHPVERLRWGEAHLARFAHPMLSRAPLLGGILSYAVESAGGNYTLNKAGVRLRGPPETLFENVHGPGYRAVYDLADLDGSRFMIATGQSGNPLSPLYGNLAGRWRDGIYVKLDGAETAAHTRLRLSPEGTAGG